MFRSPWQVALVVTLVIAVAAALLAIFSAGHLAWGTPELPKAQGEALDAAKLRSGPGATSVTREHYHPRVAGAVVREPQNTWSNLAFVFCGVLIAAHDRRPLARLLGAALVGLGLGSGLYHASLLPAIRTFDVAMMGWVTFALACLSVATVWPLFRAGRSLVGEDGGSSRAYLIGSVGGALAIVAAIFRNDVRVGGIKPFDSTYTTVGGIALVGVMVLCGAILTARRRPAARLPVARMAVLVGLVAVAIICQINDRPGRWFCNPEAAVQGHAVWHVLMAVAVGSAYDLFALIAGRTPLLRSRA